MIILGKESGGGRRIRTFELLRGQIYSPLSKSVKTRKNPAFLQLSAPQNTQNIHLGSQTEQAKSRHSAGRPS